MYLILAITEETVIHTEARKQQCRGWSQKFLGSCINDSDCTTACRNEGYLWGNCHRNPTPICECLNPCWLLQPSSNCKRSRLSLPFRRGSSFIILIKMNKLSIYGCTLFELFFSLSVSIMSFYYYYYYYYYFNNSIVTKERGI